MKTVALQCYGSPYYQALKGIVKPVPGDKEVLVRAHMASIIEAGRLRPIIDRFFESN